VTLVEGVAIEGDLHLQPRTAYHASPETPLEMLNRDDHFFPMTLAHGEVVLVGKAQVTTVAFDGSPVEDPERQSIARVLELEITMAGGRELRGIAASELPPNRSRASDFLNAPEAFFALVTPEATICVNRAHIRAARPLS
jgi:hypothetical protein